MKIFKKLVPLALSLFIIAACNSGNTNSETSASEQLDLNEIKKAAEAVSYEMNSVEDVLNTLDLVDAAYFPVICNDPYNAENYLGTKSSSAANLGVYVTDIVYHMYGEATEDMFLTFSASQELARSIGLESEFAATLLTELEGGQISRDSLLIAFSDLMEESEVYNSNEDLLYVHTAFLAGVYVEKLYITSSLLEQGQKNEKPSVDDMNNHKKLLAVFEKQLESLDVITGAIAGYSSPLGNVFKLVDFDILSGAAQKLQDETNDILKSDELLVSKELTSVYNAISNIRTRIVSAS